MVEFGARGETFARKIETRYWYQHTEIWEDERLMTFAPQAEIEGMTMRRVKAEDQDYHHISISESMKAIRDAGWLNVPPVPFHFTLLFTLHFFSSCDSSGQEA